MNWSETTQRRLAVNLAGAFVLGAMAGVARSASRARFAGPRPLIDWDRAYRIASLVNGPSLAGRLSREQREEREAHYQRIVDRVTPRMLAYLGPGQNGDFTFTTRPEVVDRDTWIRNNIGSFVMVFEPVEEVLRGRFGSQISQPVNQQVGSVFLGIMLGYLSRRVLGQYDPSLLGKEAITTGKLFFVEPNLESARQHMGLPKEQFETWIVFHELTHSWQFEAHPWLRDFMNRQIRALLASASNKLASVDAGELLRLAMRGELDPRQPQRMMVTMMSADQRHIFEQLQALMSLLEGFSNHVMDALGPEMLPDYAEISRKFEQRQTRKGQAEKLFIKVTGLEMKMEQYRAGEHFVNEVVRQRGPAFMEKVWQGPETIPTLREIYQPEEWMARTQSYSR